MERVTPAPFLYMSEKVPIQVLWKPDFFDPNFDPL